ncbi:MAG TPA: hypothetical protein VMT76_13575 [Puia sp.]|nr:hypothetical protein [Puia sp.]
MKIAFVHPHKAFLPEIEAYQAFFSRYNIETAVVRPEAIDTISADVEWHIMGIDRSKKKKGMIKVHEYASASVRPFAGLKNYSKKILNPTPDYRLFLNEFVKSKLRLKEKIPFGFRNMGVSNYFLDFDTDTIKKEFDFVYAGSVGADRKINRFIDVFSTGKLKNKSLLIVSNHYEKLKNIYKKFNNIYFAGPLPHSQIPATVSSAKFAVDFRVDEEPHNHQASTKLLEYAALKIPIISSGYEWVRNFQKENGGNFYWLENDLSNLNWDNISSFDYAFPDLSSWTWENQIRKSGVLKFLGLE